MCGRELERVTSVPRFLFLVPSFLVAGALIALTINARSLWVDEAFSVAAARLPWHDLWMEFHRRDAVFALYYVLLHLWLHVGESAIAIRSLSAVFAFGALAFTYRAGQAILGSRGGAVAAIVLALTPSFISYASLDAKARAQACQRLKENSERSLERTASKFTAIALRAGRMRR